jgi:glutamate N-acetyltransferase/amino-acid N-acetyltransferase
MDKPMNEETKPIAGPKGFMAGGACAGLKPSGALDMAAILCDRPVVAAAVTTQNQFCGAPVTVVRERLEADPHARGVLINSGIANVCTGEKGLADARAMAAAAEHAAGAGQDSCLVASTGVIGQPLPMDKIQAAVPGLIQSLDKEGWATFARAIMTTDTVPKIARRAFKVSTGLTGSATVTVLGVCKGSGMIEPNMATMLAFIATDYPLGPAQARQMLVHACDRSFNRVTVDGDTSTSDMAILLSSGAAFERRLADDAKEKKFRAALNEVCEELARAIARDGEGATKLVTVDATGARNDADAHRIAKTVANSPLVKTALFGNDPNCLGRIAAAAGRAGVAFDQAGVNIRLQGKWLLKKGTPVKFDREAMSQALKASEVTIEIHIGPGKGAARVWTCDLSYDYVKINAEYTT